MSQTIKIKKCDRKDLTYSDVEYCELVLEDDGFKIRFKGSGEVEDSDLGMKVEKNWEYDDFYLKKYIEYVSCGYSTPCERYTIGITMTSTEVCSYFFETFDEAKEVRDKILQWLRKE